MGLFDLTWLTEPLSFAFMQQALIAALLIALVCALLSCFLVLKGWSLMGDAIAHAVLPGLVMAFIAGIPLIIGAFLAGTVCALSTGFIAANSRVKEDTVLGIVFSGMFGLGLILITKVDTGLHLDQVLYGNLLGILPGDLTEITIVALVVSAILLAKRRDLYAYCFDPQHARAVALPVNVLHYGLLVMLALTIVIAIKAVGIILVVAMLVTPGATASLLTSRLDALLAWSVASAFLASIAGTLVSFHIDGATGPCIVLAQMALFILALGWRAAKRSLRLRAARA